MCGEYKMKVKRKKMKMKTKKDLKKSKGYKERAGRKDGRLK